MISINQPMNNGPVVLKMIKIGHNLAGLIFAALGILLFVGFSSDIFAASERVCVNISGG